MQGLSYIASISFTHINFTCICMEINPTGELLWKSLCSQLNFIAATSHKKSNQFEVVQLVAGTKFCWRDKDFHKNSPVHTKWSVATKCQHDMLLQLVAEYELTFMSLFYAMLCIPTPFSNFSVGQVFFFYVTKFRENVGFLAK